MMKEQISVPTATIELTEEELETMRGGWSHDDWSDDGCDDRRGWSRRGDRDDFGGDDRFSFRGYDSRCDW